MAQPPGCRGGQASSHGRYQVILARRVALVTGAGRRVGKAIALALAEQGAHVAVHYNASREGAEETAAEIRKRGGEATLFAGDLSSAAGPADLVERVASEVGELHALVNSAGVMLRTPLGEVTMEQWDSMMAVNLRAPFFASQAAAKVMGRGAAIVNIADLAAYETWPAYIPHGISKAGVVQMTRALARTLGPNIRVNAVAPGVVMLPDGWAPDTADRLASTTPLKRVGSPHDVAEAVLYLLHAEFVTGETIIVDGGRHVRH